MQNTSHAVMAQRVEAKDSLDDFPTPPWASRAFCEHILGGANRLSNLTAMEPACGRGDMAQVLSEYFGSVSASDIHPYGYGTIVDFLDSDHPEDSVDWIITNPPFKTAEKFLEKALPVARKGVALLTRTVFIESVGRFQRVFSVRPPSVVAQYVERVPMVKGRLDKKASTATGYAWLVWEHTEVEATQLRWIPPSRKRFEQDHDYDPRFRLTRAKKPDPISSNLADIAQKDLFT